MKFPALIQLVTPSSRVLMVILLLLSLGSAVSLVSPYMAGQLTNMLLETGHAYFSDINSLLVAWLLLLAIRSLVKFAADTYISVAGAKTTTLLRTRVYDHMQILPLGYFHQQKSGDLLSLMDNDANTVGWFVVGTLTGLVPALIIFSGAMILMFLIDPFVALLIVFFMPLYYLVVKFAGRKIRPLSVRWFQAYADMLSVFKENLELIQVIKTFRRERVESSRFDEGNQRLFRLSGESLIAENLLPSLASFFASAGILLLIWFISGQLETGEMTAAELVMLIFYAFLLAQPLGNLSGFYGQYQLTRGASERLLAFFSHSPEPESIGQPDIGKVLGRITFENVEFAYPGRDEALRGVNFDVQPGEMVAITGPNGCGKSTLFYLLMRFSDPGSGRILIDGKDIREFSIDSLRREVGYVSQNMLLYNGTIKDNIAYADPDATMQQIERAAQAAMAAEFIGELPEGYQTIVGDQGIRLSGGQCQRLSLARTLLRNPSVLLLDEATSMFDPDSELAFLKENWSLLSSKTVLFITHREAALAFADRSLQLAAGRLL